jgi:hypothetical protein
MRKNVGLLVGLFFFATLCLIVYLPVKAESKTITVPEDFPTIQTAVDHAFAGQTIFVRNGVYTEWQLWRLCKQHNKQYWLRCTVW